MHLLWPHGTCTCLSLISTKFADVLHLLPRLQTTNETDLWISDDINSYNFRWMILCFITVYRNSTHLWRGWTLPLAVGSCLVTGLYHPPDSRLRSCMCDRSLLIFRADEDEMLAHFQLEKGWHGKGGGCRVTDTSGAHNKFTPEGVIRLWTESKQTLRSWMGHKTLGFYWIKEHVHIFHPCVSSFISVHQLLWPTVTVFFFF